jgi:hypothetical protein
MAEIDYPAQTRVTERGVELTLRDVDGRTAMRIIPGTPTHQEIEQVVFECARELEARDG